MSVLSRCYSSPAPRSDGSAGGILSVLCITVLVLLFGLAQLRMQFSVNDLERETSSLQASKINLKSKINALRNEVEAQKQGGRLLEYASAELGMVKYPPTEWEKITVTDYMKSRYSDVEVAVVKSSDLDKKVNWSDALASRLGVAGQAQAAELAQLAEEE